MSFLLQYMRNCSGAKCTLSISADPQDGALGQTGKWNISCPPHGLRSYSDQRNLNCIPGVSTLCSLADTNKTKICFTYHPYLYYLHPTTLQPSCLWSVQEALLGEEVWSADFSDLNDSGSSSAWCQSGLTQISKHNEWQCSFFHLERPNKYISISTFV